MSFQRSMEFLGRSGVHPALTHDNMALPRITNRQQLDALGEQGMREMERDGHSLAYQQWCALLARGADSLPDMQAVNGAIPRTQAEVLRDVAVANNRSAMYLDRQRMDPALADLNLDGQPLADWDLESAHNRLAEMMMDLPPGYERDAVSDALAKLDGSVATSFTGIEWQLNDDGGGLTIEANTDATIHPNDAYAHAQQHLFNQEQGTNDLNALAIRAHRYGSDELMAGIVAMNSDGSGTVETYYDPISQAMANAGGMNQGDDGNTFEMEE